MSALEGRSVVITIAARSKARELVGSDALVAGYADRLLPDAVMDVMDVMVERFG